MKPPSENQKCINGKTVYDDGCYDCQYWIKDIPCPPANLTDDERHSKRSNDIY